MVSLGYMYNLLSSGCLFCASQNSATMLGSLAAKLEQVCLVRLVLQVHVVGQYYPCE